LSRAAGFRDGPELEVCFAVKVKQGQATALRGGQADLKDQVGFTGRRDEFKAVRALLRAAAAVGRKNLAKILSSAPGLAL